MNTKYKVDRLHLISYKNRPRKKVYSTRCRFLAKSQIVRCVAKNEKFEYINFRGSHIKKVNFDNTTFYGCDFWGVSFKDCSFKNAKISDSIFMACRFDNCDFKNATLSYSVFVNTNLAECRNIDVSHGVELLSLYPFAKHSDDLDNVLKELFYNNNLKKYRLLHLPGNKYNELNLHLLQKQFSINELSKLLQNLKNQSNRNITTYKKLESELKKHRKFSKPMI